ncbi:MAG: hypothetical protein KAV82_13390 [Phycisphaerae bacterium]|nr:hypothetical protein [Phycisphaerae bacterium]
MRVGLIQIAVTPGVRSANIARLMRLIDQTCECDPAPDLVVVPAGCESDLGHAVSSGLTRAMGYALLGPLAMKAREWGVFLAGGFWGRDESGPLVRGVLLDPDGDVLIKTARQNDAQRLPVRVWATSIGAVGLLLGEHVDDEVPDDVIEAGGVLVVSGTVCNGKVPHRRSDEVGDRLSKLAQRCASYVCGVFPVSAEEAGNSDKGGIAGPSQAFGPDGSRIACAPGGEAIVVVDLVSAGGSDVSPQRPQRVDK